MYSIDENLKKRENTASDQLSYIEDFPKSPQRSSSEMAIVKTLVLFLRVGVPMRVFF